MISPVNAGHAPQTMVWALIWLNERGHPRRSDLVIVERGDDAPQGGYPAQSYIEALTEGFLLNWRRS
jgi:hypothetical protein